MAHLFVYAMLCLVFTGLNCLMKFPCVCDMKGTETWVQARSVRGVNMNFPCYIKIQVQKQALVEDCCVQCCSHIIFLPELSMHGEIQKEQSLEFICFSWLDEVKSDWSVL